MVKKSGSGYAVFSHKTGKKLSRVYPSKRAAEKRLAQIRYFKFVGGR